MNTPDSTYQRGIDSSDIKFAKEKLVQGLRSVVREILGANGAIITENELELTDKPTNLIVPTNQTVHAFKLKRDLLNRVFCIVFENQPNGQIDRSKQAKIWQADT